MSLCLWIIALLACITPQQVRQSDARVALGTAYLREGNAPGAVLVLREAAKLNPQNAVAWERLGLAYMASAAFEESEAAFLKTIRLAEADQGRVHYNYGILLLKMERYEESITQFEMTLADLTHRTPSHALNSLGFVYYQIERYDKAIETLTDALRRSPKLCQARFHRALSYGATGDNENALKDFEAVIQTCGGEVPGAYFHAAEVLIALDLRPAACIYLKSAADAVPDSELARAANEMLAKECGL